MYILILLLYCTDLYDNVFEIMTVANALLGSSLQTVREKEARHV